MNFFFRDSIIGDLVVKMIPLPNPKSSKKAQKDQKRIADTLYSEHTFYTNGLLYSFNQNARVPRQAYGEAHGYRYLVMEKFSITLPEYVEREGGAINCSKVANIGLQILAGLEHIHNTVRFRYVVCLTFLTWFVFLIYITELSSRVISMST